MMEKIEEKRKREFFDFLIREYSFEYLDYKDKDDYTIYTTNTITIHCYADRQIPNMLINRLSEPDYFKTSLAILLESMGIIQTEKYRENLRKNGIEENIVYMKSMFAKIADAVINTPDSWWLDVQKLGFRMTEQYIDTNNPMAMNNPRLKGVYQYIKSQDPNWNSTIQFPEDWNP